MTDSAKQTPKPSLTTSEISALWTDYQQMTVSECMFNHFAQHVEDPKVQDLIIVAQNSVKEHLSGIVNILNEASFPLPIGFTSQDWNPKAPRLFEDEYYIQNIMNFSKLGMTLHATAAGNASRADVQHLYANGLNKVTELNHKTVQLALEQGSYVRPPIVPLPYKRDYVEDKRFMSPGWFTQETRPLLASEISYLHANIIRNMIGTMTITAFSQVAKDEQVRNFFIKGAKLADKQIKAHTEILLKYQIPVPAYSNSLITDSNLISPFSDKMMLFETSGMTALGITFISQSLINTMRLDIQAQYIKFSGEISKYSKEGADLLINKGWMEQPPETVDRRALANEEKKGE